MERQEPERIPFPNKLVKFRDILGGIAIVGAHALLDQFRHETPSDYPKHPKTTGRPATIPQNYDSEGREVL